MSRLSFVNCQRNSLFVVRRLDFIDAPQVLLAISRIVTGNNRQSVVAKVLFARESVFSVSTTPKAKLTLSSLNRLFDRYEPIPLFRQYLCARCPR